MAERGRLADALSRHIASTPIESGKVHHVEVRHDADCAFWHDHACDCSPTIETGARVDRKYGSGPCEPPRPNDTCHDCGTAIEANPSFVINRCVQCAIRAGNEDKKNRKSTP